MFHAVFPSRSRICRVNRKRLCKKREQPASCLLGLQAPNFLRSRYPTKKNPPGSDEVRTQKAEKELHRHRPQMAFPKKLGDK